MTKIQNNQSLIKAKNLKLAELVPPYCNYVKSTPKLTLVAPIIGDFLAQWMKGVAFGEIECTPFQARVKFADYKANIDDSYFATKMEKLLVEIVELRSGFNLPVNNDKIMITKPKVPLTERRKVTVERNVFELSPSLRRRAEADEIDVHRSNSESGGCDVVIIEPSFGNASGLIFPMISARDPDLENKINEFREKLLSFTN